MSPAPAIPAVSETWYQELAVAQPRDADRGYPLLILLGAFGAAFGPLHDLVRDSDDGVGWSALWDPDRCPAWALPWAAMTLGVELPPGSSEAEQRALLADPPQFKRCTRSAFEDAITATLDAPEQLTVYEREGTPRRVVAITYTPQTPDPDATLAAAESQTPLHAFLDMRVYDGWDYRQLGAAYSGQTYADLAGDWADYVALHAHLP